MTQTGVDCYRSYPCLPDFPGGGLPGRTGRPGHPAGLRAAARSEAGRAAGLPDLAGCREGALG